MLKINQEEINRWRVELDQADKFREENFGAYDADKRIGVGENLDYFEWGQSGSTARKFTPSTYVGSTLNLIFPIVKNIVPSLYFQNPKILAFPKRKEDQDSAPISAEILNYYHKELGIKQVNQQVIFDSYLLGMGVCKIGYATQFGADIPDENLEKEREKKKQRGFLEKLGLKKPKPEEPKENVELNEFIRSESPYIIYVNPFEFGIDPRATSIHNACYVYQKVKKTLKQVKEDKNYSNTKDLQPSPVDVIGGEQLSESQLEDFQTIDLYEIHYKTDSGINILVIVKDQNTMKAIYHEESVYEIDGFQYEVLTLNKHGHRLYPISDISVVRFLQDRIVTSFDSILDQVDRFVPKLLVDENSLGEGGKQALENGETGDIVYTNKDPNQVGKEFNITQVKADLIAFIERLVDMASLGVGLTRAQLTGLTTAQTATEAQIGQLGQNLRRSDQAEFVVDFINRQSRKFWQVIAQFVDLEELQLITGEPLQDPQGNLQFNWLTVSPEIKNKLIKGEYRFDIEVGSAQKPNIEVIRQQATNLVRDLFNPVVEQTLNQEGTHLNHTELLRGLIKLMPDFIKNPERVLQQANQQQQQLGMAERVAGVQQPSGRGNSLENAQGNVPQAAPTQTSMAEEVGGMLGQAR